MANIQHSTCADSERHEPKGASTASDGDVLVSDGAAGTDWGTAPRKDTFTFRFADISTADDHYMVLTNPDEVTATVSKIWTVIDGALATADCVLSFELDGSAVTNGDITVAYSGSAAGDVDSSTPSGNHTFTATNGVLKMTSDGASTNTVEAVITVEVTYTKDV